MPWKEIKVVDQRKEFVKAFLEKKFKIAQLCRQFSISRPTAYKWLKRFEEEGLDGLIDISRAPHHQSNMVSEDIVNLIITVKSNFPTWGPKKIHAYINNHHELEKCPCQTSVENILKRNGLVKPRKYRLRLAKRTEPLQDCYNPNDIWCTDFKGWSKTSDGHKFGPYTLMDADSRFLIACVQLDADNTDHVWAVLEKSFYEFGLPDGLRSDNGPPFATTAPGRLSKLGIKLIKAGVIPEWIEPGHPEQNGRQERMHGTLQAECMSNDLSLIEHTRRIEEFRDYYNFIRPHEALKQKCPGEVYIPSNRAWNGKPQSPEYQNCYKVGKVKSCGKMSWSGGEVYISRVFEGEPIGIYESENGLAAYYGPIFLGIINGNHLVFERRTNRRGK